MLKKVYYFFIYSFFLFCPTVFLSLFSQEVSSLKIGNSDFSVDDIQKITFVQQGIYLFLKNNVNSRIFGEQTCYFTHPAASLPEELNANLQVFNYHPNPVIDILHLSDDVSLDAISIYDIHGKLLKTYQTEDSSTYLDLSDVNPGMYLIITSNHSFKIIKK